MCGVKLGGVLLVLPNFESGLVFQQRLEVHVHRPVLTLQSHFSFVLKQETDFGLLLGMSHKVNLVEFGGYILDFAHHFKRQWFVLEVLDVVEVLLVPLFEQPFVVCSQFVSEVALDVVLSHTGHQRVFTHVDVLGK